MLVLIDYGSGNIFSLSQAIKSLNIDFCVTSDPDEILAASSVILPGVGAFSATMHRLNEAKLLDPIKKCINEKIPFLGICVGCQVLFEESEELGDCKGLGVFQGTVRRLPMAELKNNDISRIPNVGWRQIYPMTKDVLFPEAALEHWYYFTHSYAADARDREIVMAKMNFNRREIDVAFKSGATVGVQFHPEKSGQSGLDFLQRFCGGLI
ncbi:imidazole glycerol phosphate synthase subunit HisH [Paracoccaceae bacterium]|nr:imidazole glycerol phosphate synthase subunit HisH [Paracoccaceae bacterium]